MTNRALINGTLILIISGFVIKIIGFAYRIYISKLIGAEGMGLFQLVSPIYTLVVLTLTSGVSIAVSRLAAKVCSEGFPKTAGIIMRRALLGVFVVGCSLAAILWLLQEEIAFNILGDGRAYFSLAVIIPCIPFIVSVSAVKGYFYGVQKTIPPAVAQIVEQILRFSFVLFYADIVKLMGLEYGCAIVLLGAAVGEIGGGIFLVLIYIFQNINSRTDELQQYNNWEVLKIATPISLNRFITSLLATVELILIPVMLQKYGFSYTESIEELGKFSGMAIPLIMFPALATSALATTLVPAITQATAMENRHLANYRISKSIRVTILMGTIFTAVFMLRSSEIASIVYKNQGIESILLELSTICAFVYLQQTLLGIMNGLGKQGLSLVTSIVGYAVRIVCVVFIIPGFGLSGYIWGNLISFALICILNIHFIVKTTGMIIDLGGWIIKPIILFTLILLCTEYLGGIIPESGIIQIDRWISLIGGVFLASLFIKILEMVLRKKDYSNSK